MKIIRLLIVSLFFLITARVYAATALTATFLAVGGDVVSQNVFSPGGQADLHIALDELRSGPMQIPVTFGKGGIWKTPFTGTNWVRHSALNGTSAGIYFAHFPTESFQVQVAYADGRTDQANGLSMPPPTALEARWTALKNAIRARNFPLALEQILTSRRAHYQEAFKQMTTTTPNLGEIRFFKNISPIEVEYETLVIENVFTYSYPVIFGKDIDGEWRIETF